MDNKQAVLYRKEGGVAIITMNRPEVYNAVNDELLNGLTEAVREARRDEEVRAVILTGNGRGFCSGADLGNFTAGVTPEEGREYITTNYGGLMRNLLTMRKPIIGALNGSAAGVGCAIGFIF